MSTVPLHYTITYCMCHGPQLQYHGLHQPAAACHHIHPERTEYKVAVLVYKVLNGSAPRYLGPLTRVADLPGRRALRSADTNRLHIPPVRLSTVGTRAFSVAGPRIWNNLPEYITSAESLHTFCHRLKTHLFQRSFL